MAFAPKIDFSGLGTLFTNNLAIRSDNPNFSSEEYKPTGQHGDFIELEEFGLDASPANSFAVIKDIVAEPGKLTLGTVRSVTAGGYTDKKYALESVTINTTGGAEPTLDATSKMVEDSADTASSSTYSIPAFTLRKRHCAQDIFDAIKSVTGPAEMTACSTEIGCKVQPTKVAGVILASDVKEGQIVVTASFLRKGSDFSTPIVVTPADGWTVKEVVSPDNPETSKPTVQFTLTKLLTKSEPAS